jgi:BirA family biotin operon repressor/biotin-[acetyl-CoA-carboxylase] ligase
MLRFLTNYFKKTKRFSFDELDSTQRWSVNHLDEISTKDWMVVTAQKQTLGMGRRGKSWYSPEGNLYVTFSTRLPKSMLAERAADMKGIHIPQIASLSVAQTLESFALTPKLKWINDVLLNGKKIGGVLTQMQEGCVIIGIGLNVNMTKEDARKISAFCPGEPNHIPATSLSIEAHQSFKPEIILKRLHQNLVKNIELYFEGTHSFIEVIEARLTCHRGDIITIIGDDGTELRGEFLGLNSLGGLRLKRSHEEKTVGARRAVPLLDEIELFNGHMILPIPEVSHA